MGWSKKKNPSGGAIWPALHDAVFEQNGISKVPIVQHEDSNHGQCLYPGYITFEQEDGWYGALPDRVKHMLCYIDAKWPLSDGEIQLIDTSPGINRLKPPCKHVRGLSHRSDIMIREGGKCVRFLMPAEFPLFRGLPHTEDIDHAVTMRHSAIDSMPAPLPGLAVVCFLGVRHGVWSVDVGVDID